MIPPMDTYCPILASAPKADFQTAPRRPAEGVLTPAEGVLTLAEGALTLAEGAPTPAEGAVTRAEGVLTLAEGVVTAIDPAKHRGVLALRCDGGIVWVTQTGAPEDVVLHAGQSFTPRRNGKIVVQPLSQSALIRVTT
jgi:hypothetical protein